jgi:hypothetical protein
MFRLIKAASVATPPFASRIRFEEQKENGIVRLRPEALRRYLTAYEAFMRRSPGEGASSWRERLDEQVRRMARAVWSGSLYTPFRMEA